jgi:hypothetical protein
MNNRADLINKKIGKLTVISFNEEKETRRGYWNCVCECQNMIIVRTDKLQDGSTLSCGCLNSENGKIKALKMKAAWQKYSPSEATARIIWKQTYNEMDFNDFIEASKLNCFKCNAPPSVSQNRATKKSSEDMKKNGFFTYNHIVKINNELPYSKDNVITACPGCKKCMKS